MKLETQELPDSQVQLSFEIEDARVERAMEAAYRRLAGRVSIAGFRRGKAPRALVERVLGREALLEEALNRLLPEVYEEALREANLRALTDPEFNVESVTPLRARATVVVPPPVQLGDYRAIRRELSPVTVGTDEVEAALNQLREAHAQWVPVDRPAQLGDLVTIDVEGRADGGRAFNRENVEYVLEEGSTSPMPGFAEQLVGIQAGETREFTLTEAAPEGGSAEPPPRRMTFRVTAQDVKEKELPALDDDFAVSLGTYTDLEDLRARVEQQLRERAEEAARTEARQQILEAAVSGATVTLPAKLVEQQVHRLRDRLSRQLDSRGLTIEQYLRVRHTSPEQFEAELTADAERILRRSLVMQEIAAREGIAVTDEEVDAGIRQALEGGETSERAIAAALRSGELRERVRMSLLEERAAAWLIDHAMSDGQAETSHAEGQDDNHA